MTTTAVTVRNFNSEFVDQLNANFAAIDTALTNVQTNVTSLAALKALSATSGIVVSQYRTTAGDGGGGVWVWRSGDQSANITSDTQSGIWAAPNSDSTGASGAWQRQYTGPLDARWFGAVGDDSTNNSTAISAWLAAAAGKTAYLPPGTYRSSGAHTVSAGTYVVGDDAYASVLKTTSATNTFLTLAASCSLKRIKIVCSTTRTAGYYVDITGNDVILDDCEFGGYFIGVNVGTLAGSFISLAQVLNCTFRNPATASGTGAVQFIKFSTAVVHGCLVIGDAGTQPNFGLRFQYGDTAFVTDTNVTLHGKGLYIDPQDGYSCYAAKFSNCCFDSAGTISGGSTVSSAEITPATNATVMDTTFTACWFGLSASKMGCYVAPAGTGVVDGLTFSNCQFVGNGDAGLLVDGSGVKNWSVVGGYSSDNTNYGLRAAGATTRFVISSHRAGNIAARGGNAYGIYIDAAASDYYTIQGCNLEGNTTAALTDGGTGTNKLICHNYGTTVVAGTDYVSALNVAGTVTFSGAITYGGVTLTNNVTGTGKMVLDTAPLLNGMASIIADNSTAYALDIRGRSSDNISILAFKSNDDGTEYCKLQVSSSAATFSGKTFTAGSGLTISSGQVLQLGNAYVGGAPAATGYVTLKDSGGTTYKVLVGT